jgi:hypothetical protein
MPYGIQQMQQHSMKAVAEYKDGWLLFIYSTNLVGLSELNKIKFVSALSMF